MSIVVTGLLLAYTSTL